MQSYATRFYPNDGSRPMAGCPIFIHSFVVCVTARCRSTNTNKNAQQCILCCDVGGCSAVTGHILLCNIGATLLDTIHRPTIDRSVLNCKDRCDIHITRTKKILTFIYERSRAPEHFIEGITSQYALMSSQCRAAGSLATTSNNKGASQSLALLKQS